MNKKALSRNGHLVFSGLLVVGGLYFLGYYIEIPLLKLLWHIPSFLGGVLFVDLLEKPGLRLVKHRSFFHSKRMLWFTMIIFIPISVWLGIYKHNYWFFITSFLVGHLSHLWGDSLTSPLPR